MAINDFVTEYDLNLEDRWLCVVLVDVSSSMSKEALLAFNEEIYDFHQLIIEGKDTTISIGTLELCFMEFDQTIRVLQEPSLVDSFSVPFFKHNPTITLGDLSLAAHEAVDKIVLRKKWYHEVKNPFVRPCFILVTSEASEELYKSDSFAWIRDEVSAYKYDFLNVGMNGSWLYAKGDKVSWFLGRPLLSQLLCEVFCWADMTIGLPGRNYTDDTNEALKYLMENFDVDNELAGTSDDMVDLKDLSWSNTFNI